MAPCGGRIEAIVTRSGTPLCQKGDVVKKGQVLIQGSYDIVGDDEQIIRKQGVTADGEIRHPGIPLNGKKSYKKNT